MTAIKVKKEEFLSMPSEERDWAILETFSSQVKTCGSRFEIIESKIGWARTVVIAIVFFCVGAGALEMKTIWKFVSKFLGW